MSLQWRILYVNNTETNLYGQRGEGVWNNEVHKPNVVKCNIQTHKRWPYIRGTPVTGGDNNWDTEVLHEL